MRKDGVSDFGWNILCFIKGYIEEKGYPPSLGDVAAGVHLSRTHVVHEMTYLMAWGYVYRERGVPRSIVLLKDFDCPPLGSEDD